MALNYDYDEVNETWPFFLLTVLLLVLLPMTCYFVYVQLNSVDDSASENKYNDQYTDVSILQMRQKFSKSGKSVWTAKWLVYLTIGWLLVAFIVQNNIISNESISDNQSVLFDPYELLGVSMKASDKEIKSAYRKLSLKFHPDKVSKDLTDAEKLHMEELYVKITKAYESLTDEIVKANYLKYGHPDGPQAVTHGIALPRFLVDTQLSPLLVLVYVLSFVLVLPYFVSKWWSKTQSFTKKGINTKTASYFVDRLVNYKPSEIVTVDLIIKWLSHAEEFKQMYSNLDATTFEKLLNDHLTRKDSGSQGLNEAKFRIVAKAHTLLYGFLDIATGFKNTEVTLMILNTFKCLVQAVKNDRYSEVMQLPNVNEETLRSNKIYTLGKLFTLEEKDIAKTLGLDLNSVELKDTLEIAKTIPMLHLLKAEFVVPGEDSVTPMSLPHISLKILVRNAQQKIIPAENFPQEMLSDSQDLEDLQDPYSKIQNEPILPYSFAPHFSTKRRNTWCCLLVLQKDNKIIQSPYIIERLNLNNLQVDFDKLKVKNFDKFNPSEWSIANIKIPLGQQAPQQTGKVFFRVIMKSTDYFGSDLDFTMCMNVVEPPKETDDSLLYEDEDENESEDESEDDDDDIYSDYSDIDTDTDAEN